LPFRSRTLDRFPYRARFSVALGHRLVLVLEERVCAAASRASAVRPQASELHHLSADHALERTLGAHARLASAARRAPGIGYPGPRHSPRPRGGVSRLHAQGGRDIADLALSHQRVGSERTLRALSDAP